MAPVVKALKRQSVSESVSYVNIIVEQGKHRDDWARDLVTSHQSPPRLKHSDEHNCRYGHNPSDRKENVQ
jgi:hypothetical protein